MGQNRELLVIIAPPSVIRVGIIASQVVVGEHPAAVEESAVATLDYEESRPE